ncbi:MAG: magnesium transporter CorA family protein [Actinomycetota bacterium]
MLLAVCYDRETGWQQVSDTAGISELRARGRLIWAEADVKDLDDDDVATIAREFSLHELAVEDAVTLRQRPKFETFPDHLFVVVHQLDESGDQLEPAQLSMFVGDHYVLALHGGANRTLEEARRRWMDLSHDQAGPHRLLHTILDTIVDEYGVLADQLEQETEDLEELTLESIDLPMRARFALVNDSSTQRRIYSVKQRVSRLRRYGHPAARVVEGVLEAEAHNLADSKLVPLFAHVRDHALRIGDQVGGVESLTNAILDLRRAEAAGTLNEVTKKLTAWAAIIAVPTLISSVYGMNVHLYPPEGTTAGFWFALGLMAVLGAGLFVFFKRRRWL